MTYSDPLPISLDQIRQGSYNAREFAPALWEIPREFVGPGAWHAVASGLMWSGSTAIQRAHAKPGITREAALLHVGAVLHAQELSIDHREAAAAYLLANWFDTVQLFDGVGAGIGMRRSDEQGSLSIGG
jgi:hypothetical protein